MDTIIVWLIVALAVVFVVRRFACGRGQGCGCGCSGGCAGGCDGPAGSTCHQDGTGRTPGRPLDPR